MTTATAPRLASEAQMDLIRRLATERGYDQSLINFTELTGGRNGTASQLITKLFAMARADGKGESFPRAKQNVEAGLYRRGEDIVRVKISRTTGNWYAELATKPVEGSGRKSLDWKYVGIRIDMSDAQPMADDEAGKLLGYCIRCNAELTDPESIARGMGPVCATKGM